MADCRDDHCKKRFYSFSRINGEYQYHVTFRSVAPTADNPNPEKVPVTTVHKEDKDAINKYLEDLERDGEVINPCPGKCKCPNIDKPPLGKDPWPDEDDESTFHTQYTDKNGHVIVVYFTIKYKYVDRERGCIPE